MVASFNLKTTTPVGWVVKPPTFCLDSIWRPSQLRNLDPTQLLTLIPLWKSLEVSLTNHCGQFNKRKKCPSTSPLLRPPMNHKNWWELEKRKLVGGSSGRFLLSLTSPVTNSHIGSVCWTFLKNCNTFTWPGWSFFCDTQSKHASVDFNSIGLILSLPVEKRNRGFFQEIFSTVSFSSTLTREFLIQRVSLQ